MKPLPIIILMAVMCLLIIPSVSAANVSASRGLTFAGPTGLLVPLGIENAIPLNQALIFYQWISVGLLMLIGAMASQRNTRFFAILLPIFAALFAWFGWFRSGNTAQLWGIIIMSGVLGTVVYMAGTNKEKWGSGGPGNKLVNIVLYLILLQTVVGFVNGIGMWDENTGTIEPDNPWQNVDLQTEIPTLSNTGGLFNDAMAAAAFLAFAGLLILKTVLLIMMSIVCFAVVLYMTFPFLQAPIPMALLAVFQVGIWILYVYFMFVTLYKPTLDPGYI